MILIYYVEIETKSYLFHPQKFKLNKLNFSLNISHISKNCSKIFKQKINKLKY